MGLLHNANVRPATGPAATAHRAVLCQPEVPDQEFADIVFQLM